MINIYLNMFKATVLPSKWRNAIALVVAVTGPSMAFAQAYGGTALCTFATNTKLTLGIAAVLGILIGAILAVFKKGDHLLDTVMVILLVCGVAVGAGVLIRAMGLTIDCAGI